MGPPGILAGWTSLIYNNKGNMPKPNIIDNLELVTGYMTCGSPMNQAFAIEAIRQYAEFYTQNEEKARASWPERSMISFDCWLQCAKDWLECQEKRDKHNKQTFDGGPRDVWN